MPAREGGRERESDTDRERERHNKARGNPWPLTLAKERKT